MAAYGYRIDLPNPKDFNFRDLFQRLTQAKVKMAAGADVDLRPYTTPSNQYSLSSCVGNATADSVEILNAIDGKPRVELSRLFVYAMARIQHNELANDGGTYIRTAFYTLSKFGVCSEAIWPYNTKKVLTSPSIMAQREALGHKIHSFYRIDSRGQQRIDEITAALRSYHPVVFGTKVAKPFMAISNLTPVKEPSKGIVGGHAMIVVGILGGNFLVKNSWGTRWGTNGFCLMTPSYLAWNGTHDLWVPTLGAAFKK